MATLNDTLKPDEAHLSQYLDEALCGRSDEEYVSEFISGTNNTLSSNPRFYRAYGPFWPAIKQMLVEHGHTGYGREVDTAVAALYSYERQPFTLIAGALYSQARLASGLVYVSEHVLPTNEGADSETYTYYSDDDQIEIRLV